MSWTRISVAAFVLAGVVMAGFCARQPPIPVEAAAARERQLTVRVNTNGKVEPIDKAEVRSRLGGRIVEIREPGVRVAEGELLVRIDRGPVEAELVAAKSERLSARDALRAARDVLARVAQTAVTDEQLHEQGGITRERYLETHAQLKEARARVGFLEREVPLREASLDLRIRELTERRDAAEVRAPFSGTVYETSAKLGQMVDVGDPILRFADLERLRVRANVDQVDLGRVTVGQPVRVSSNAYPGHDWSARISELIPNVVLKESRFVADGLARVEPPTSGLVPGMTVDVEIQVDDVPRALQVPAEAIFTDDTGSFVYRIDEDRVRETRVSVGRSTIAMIEIVDGLQVDDWVALGPVAGLEDGARVEAHRRDDG